MDDYFNNFTEALDEYVVHTPGIDEEWYKFGLRTYICLDDLNQDADNNTDGCYHVAFRFPGATRGHITVDKDLIIKDIVFYDTCWNNIGVYDKNRQTQMVTDITKRFRDTKLDVEHGILQDDFIEQYSKEVSNGKTSGPKENM